MKKSLPELIESPACDKPGEECGIFGISTREGDEITPAVETYLALFSLQHRGQQSCGIATSENGSITTYKRTGLVSDVFSEEILDTLKGSMSIGHVRYSTKKELSSSNAQPITTRHINGNLSVVCNGTLVNAEELRKKTEMRGGIFQSMSIAEIISYELVRERLTTGKMEEALKNAMQCLSGAYSMLVLSGRKLIAARDPHGFRPLCMGRLGGSVVFASESCAFDAIGAEFVRDVRPGEIIVAENGEATTVYNEKGEDGSLCVFEFIYFARPDSVIDGVSVEKARQEAGRCLARKSGTDADVVIGVPDSGLSAALGFAIESGIPYATGLIKNRYIGRTFIQPTQRQRETAVKIKLNTLAAAITGKRVIMVDDSIVRGTTCARIVSLLREAGATEVHMKVSSPPFLHPCYFGTDIGERDVLIAHNHNLEEIRAIIGVDSLQYLDLEDVPYIVRDLDNGYCEACFTGRYPIPVAGEEPQDKNEGRRAE